MYTDNDLQGLKSAILGDPLLASLPNNSDGNANIAYEMNKPHADFYVWTDKLSTDDMFDVIDWAVYNANTTDGQKLIFLTITNRGEINPSKAGTRQALATVFSDPALAASKAALITIATRKATRAEAAMSTSGLGTIASPGSAKLGYINFNHVKRARSL